MKTKQKTVITLYKPRRISKESISKICTKNKTNKNISLAKILKSKWR
ncbi:MAG: hypothetical protein QME51_10465 [Planctomycetota bacterium]|nr:hypothetical protein [Planctomycetota bacterium]